jgi:hypothetical protein
VPNLSDSSSAKSPGLFIFAGGRQRRLDVLELNLEAANRAALQDRSMPTHDVGLISPFPKWQCTNSTDAPVECALTRFMSSGSLGMADAGEGGAPPSTIP